ncbi:MAG TPA: hypothetical protein VGQ53_16240 [Chitinophagaceae bacterium]|jgi:hypothetical protein|nr:hypothetical protein [Chitinophagaceae bacterium]
MKQMVYINLVMLLASLAKYHVAMDKPVSMVVNMTIKKSPIDLQPKTLL